MNLAWKIFRALVSTLLILAVGIPVSLYIMLSLDPVQNKIRNIASTELSNLLGANVEIGKVNIHPFNRLSISDVTLNLDTDSIAAVNHVSAGFELFHFIHTGELIIDYALVEGASFSLHRDEPAAPLNIAPILERLKSDKPASNAVFDLRINTVVLRDASLSYDILSEPHRDDNRFDASHISVKGLEVNAYIPRISNSRYTVHLDHLAFEEQCGFTLGTMRFKADVGNKNASLSDFYIALPSSQFSLSTLSLSYPSLSRISEAFKTGEIAVATASSSRIYPPDLGAFLPQLAKIDTHFILDFDIVGNINSANIKTLSLKETDISAFSLVLSGSADSITSKENLTYSIDRLTANVDGKGIASLTSGIIKPDLRKTLSQIPPLTLTADAAGSLRNGDLNLKVTGKPGEVDGNFRYTNSKYSKSLAFDVDLEDLSMNMLTGISDLGNVSANISGDITSGNSLAGNITLNADKIQYKGYSYANLATDIKVDTKGTNELNLSLDDENARILAYFFYENGAQAHTLQGTLTASEIDPVALGLTKAHEGKRISAKLNTSLTGSNISDIAGTVQLFDIRWTDARGQGLRINRIMAEAFPQDAVPEISIYSDFLTGNIRGQYDFVSLPGQMRNLISSFLPALFPAQKNHAAEGSNNFSYEFTILPAENVYSFFNLPFQPLYNVTLDGIVDSDSGNVFVNLDAPYLQKGDKLYENTNLLATIDTENAHNSVYATTQFPTKKGDMSVSALIGMKENRLDTRIDWQIDRAIPLNGTLAFDTHIRSIGKTGDAVFPADVTVHFLPGTINFGDEVWTIRNSQIDVTPNRVKIEDFKLSATDQDIAINGSVGEEYSDSLSVILNNIALLPIFDTLEIEKAMIGGRASGTFTARNILGGAPYFQCPALHVDSIGYQRCTIGDADILAKWDNDQRSFFLDADMTGFEGKKSRIYGDIFPFGEALDIKFDADSVPVGFLKPFMSAFASDISGRASGYCRLFGTFKEIDLEGDIFADNVTLKIDFTGTSYSATDSVHLRPGNITLTDVVIRDSEGHKAMLTGNVGHKFFKEPTFKFDISHAHNFLSYNVSPKDNPDWYGTIYGNGGASISGYPGVVDINVAMSTAPKSTFTFVLNDRLDAESYNFLTFRDVTPDSLKTVETVIDDTPAAVRAFRQKLLGNVDSPSAYNMDIRVDVTKDADMTLVMDPVGGDEIKAHGEGNLHLAYSSTNNDLNIWGKYTLADGSYKFTLQDIIIKDFTIKEGSMIQFDGDPYGVKTSLEAFYATTANLSDLDESFLQDKEVARTKVPVHALMKVKGDIRQPSIDFDLEFPTLTSDTYRKVRSIVSTSDMMNRQIIYLLALNRFYTPDYMSSTTKGSELMSVASSTISSQLGNMLGKLSDKWTIAPNFRSDKGDFSDVEVDVALSSRLLNNRLIFNGNFGYRDKTLNSNQFIGDFDIEYLLNKRGSWRLKAYNRYNDRNYYVRTAQTTQGVGIMFRRDFDDILHFLRRRHKENSAAPDSVAAEKQ
ncbi:MAG: hypothetical protein HDS65_11140 [Bacteroidales bacterium]|nr:hypothetical protein [Bacteroidales bacterium]